MSIRTILTFKIIYCKSSEIYPRLFTWAKKQQKLCVYKSSKIPQNTFSKQENFFSSLSLRHLEPFCKFFPFFFFRPLKGGTTAAISALDYKIKSNVWNICYSFARLTNAGSQQLQLLLFPPSSFSSSCLAKKKLESTHIAENSRLVGDESPVCCLFRLRNDHSKQFTGTWQMVGTR